MRFATVAISGVQTRGRPGFAGPGLIAALLVVGGCASKRAGADAAAPDATPPDGAGGSGDAAGRRDGSEDGIAGAPAGVRDADGDRTDGANGDRNDAAAGDRNDGAGAGSLVLPEDTVLTPPVPAGAILGTVTGYELSSGCPLPSPNFCESPIYTSYDRNTPAWWDILVDEHLLSRVNVVMAHGRGCFDPNTGTDGNGNMCPRLLANLVAAVDRAGAGDVYRVGMWDDTGAYPGARNRVDRLPDGTAFDLADRTSWRFFWDYNMRIWHDTIPSRLWYRLDGRPVVAFWSLASAFFSHQQGNASLLLRDLRAKFQARYGEDPVFIVDQTWTQLDTTITTGDAQGMNAWFVPPGNNFTYRNWGGASWGALVPGFRDAQTLPGCGAACREVPRRDGQALRDALAAGASARFSLLEGWTDIFESAGYYRSAAWRFPNQYIDIVREHADPAVATLRFQAESADLFSAAPAGGTAIYRAGVGNIGKLADNTGWFVDWTRGAGWLEYTEVSLTCGTYRFTARVAATAPTAIHLEVDGVSAGAVAVPATGGPASYTLVHLGAVAIPAGKHRLRLVSDAGGASADWFFLRRSASCN